MAPHPRQLRPSEERKLKDLPNRAEIHRGEPDLPRFHQWDAVLKLLEAAKAEKAGHTYLIEHSAGSGKSNSIAWLAHHLASLHDDQDQKVFDSIIVITDRTVLDKQLQDTIYQFEHKHGVVERVTDDSGSDSTQLADALLARKPIIIVTIQTFGFVLKKIQTDEALRSRSFAVIADEAHSSQTGSAAANLAPCVGQGGYEEGEEVSFEDLLLADQEATSEPVT